MAVYRVQMPDGRVARVQANSPDEALAFARNGLKPAAGQGDYAGELAKARARAALGRDDQINGDIPLPGGGKLHVPGMGAFDALTRQPPIPILDELNAGAHALGNTIWNKTYRAATGAPPVDSQAIYNANMQADAEDAALRRNAHPVATTVGGLLSGLSAGPADAAQVLAAKATPGLLGAAARVANPAVKPAIGLAGRAAAASKASAVGGTMGAAYGAAEGQGAQRLDNAKAGALGGAIGGGLFEGVAAPLVEATGNFAGDVARGFKRLSAGEPKPGPVYPTADEVQAAQQAAYRLAAKKGLTADNIGDAASRYAGKDPMFSELMGSEGVMQHAATSRRGGTTGDASRAAVYMRSRAAPERIATDFKDMLGVDPEFAAGDVQSGIERARAKANPLYTSALASPEGVWSPDLERLSTLPDVQKALGLADQSERIAQRGARGLTYGRVEVPNPAEGAAPGAGQAAGPVRGPATAPSRGPSLLQFISKTGGLDDLGGDVAAMGGDQWHAGKPFTRNLIGNHSADDMAMKAWEAGYFPELSARPTIDDLHDAIGAELRGSPRYSANRQFDQGAQDRFDGRNAADEAIYRGHTGDPAPSPDDYQGSPAPEFEPAFMDAPTAATWDKVRKKIGNMVERDPITKQVVKVGPTGDRNHDLDSLYGQLTGVLAGDDATPGLIPGYRAALDAGGDAPRMQSAFDRIKGALTRGTMRDFARTWSSLKTPGEITAGHGALASDVMDLWGSGQLKGGKFAVPAVANKLEWAFPGKSQAFIDRMEAEAELAASGNRIAPFSGSPTMSLQNAADETDQPLLNSSDTSRIFGKFGKGNLLGGAADAVGTGVKNLGAYGRTSGTTEGMRNEYGRVLQMDPDEAAEFLRSWENRPDTLKKLYPFPAGVAAGSLVGQTTGP